MRLFASAWIVACALSSFAAPPVVAPTGVWERQAGEYTITMRFEKDRVKINVQGSGSSIDTEAAYGTTGEGLLFAVLTRVDKNGIDAANKGDLFSFKYKQETGKLTISELKIDSSEAKPLLEGAYKPVAR